MQQIVESVFFFVFGEEVRCASQIKLWFEEEKQLDFNLANNCQWPLATFPIYI